MESTILSGKAAEFIQTINNQTQVSQARSIATSFASGTSAAGQKLADRLPDDPPMLSRAAKKWAINKEAAAKKARAAAGKATAEAIRVAEAAKKKNDGPSRAPHKIANPNAGKTSTEGAPKGK
jgi:hypothetical protein